MGRASLSLLLVASSTLSGCRSILGIETPLVADGPDDPDADARCAIHGVDLCALTPGPARQFMSSTVLTTTSVGPNQCDAAIRVGGQSVCLVYATSILITGQLRLIGSNPVIIASAGDLLVTSSGMVDVANGGAGADVIDCRGRSGQDEIAPLGGSGGAGGSFRAQAGSGGSGGGSGVPSSPAVSPPTFPRGGCRGGNGGTAGGSIARGGSSGGGVWLFARDTLTIDGLVVASGTGGEGGGSGSQASGNGGGGGGSGGFVLLAAQRVVVNGNVAAKGGGGGGGGNASSVGQPGQVGSFTLGTAMGGAGASGGGNGGASPITGDAVAGAPRQSSGGGGGGGGGSTGLVMLDASMTTLGVAALILPPASASPPL